MEKEIELSTKDLEAIKKVEEHFKFKITDNIANIINTTQNQGLRKQFIPSLDEFEKHDSEFHDVCDECGLQVKGVEHKYPGKILLMLSYNCFGNCRFCFRKGIKPYSLLTPKNLDQAFSYIDKNNISEVILSGGDPLTVSDSFLENVIDRLEELSCVEFVRVHTRCLTFNPARITSNLLEKFKKSKQLVSFVFHVNQAEEIDTDFMLAAQKIHDSGFLMFSQTALLKGVNDSAEALKNLFTSLLKNRVKPYYLFHSDPVHGSSHFRVSLKDGINIYKSIYNNISGLAIPIYLINLPPGKGHVIVDLGNIKSENDNKYVFENWKGEIVDFYDVVNN